VQHDGDGNRSHPVLGRLPVRRKTRLGTEWLKTLQFGPEDTEKLLNGNARRRLELCKGRTRAPTSSPPCLRVIRFGQRRRRLCPEAAFQNDAPERPEGDGVI
jgi:hypothetical protein